MPTRNQQSHRKRNKIKCETTKQKNGSIQNQKKNQLTVLNFIFNKQIIGGLIGL